MQNTFGTIIAVGLVAGGFLVTGDLGWCVRRVARVFHGTSLPTADEPAVTVSEPVVGAAAAPAAPTDEPVGVRPAPAAPAPRRPPAAGLERVELTQATPGQRVVVWTAARGGPSDCHVIHVLDAASGEALLQRRGAGGDGPARRVVIATATSAAAFSGGAETGVLRVRGTVQVRPVGLTPGLDGIVEVLGPITALAIE